MFDTGELPKATICRSVDYPELVEDFFRFRHVLFVETLGWDLKSTCGKEIDQFDQSYSEYCIVTDQNKIIAGFRAVRTDNPYLGAEVFPKLASTREYPSRTDTWEISRFGIAPHLIATDVSRITYSLMFRFAQRRGAAALVAIADLVYERYLRTLGIRTRRYGPPQIIGTDALGRKLRCIAGEIPLADQDSKAYRQLLDETNGMEIEDATLVFGHQAVSA